MGSSPSPRSTPTSGGCGRRAVLCSSSRGPSRLRPLKFHRVWPITISTDAARTSFYPVDGRLIHRDARPRKERNPPGRLSVRSGSLAGPRPFWQRCLDRPIRHPFGAVRYTYFLIETGFHGVPLPSVPRDLARLFVLPHTPGRTPALNSAQRSANACMPQS
jgi:hypothetical protein